jgi:hypothetical protein
MGGVAPIAMQILLIVNRETFAIAQYLKWYFTFIPIYNMNYGYISICNRAAIEAVEKLNKDSLKPLDWLCAGESLYWI